MRLTRARALAMLVGAAALPACGGAPALRVGSKNFTEDVVLAEIYAQALEAKGLRVGRRFNLGSTQIALAALQRGDIDLYPEYTGTALIDVLHLPPMRDATALYRVVKSAFARRYGLVWLDPAPMNDSQGLATTPQIARRYGFSTLSQLSRVAPLLRLATIQEFLGRPDGLSGLQRFYGGFQFKEVRTYDIGLKYDALLQGKADVATAFTTDGEISANDLLLIGDDRHFWPAYNAAPVVRAAALRAHPQIGPALDAVSPFITSAAARRMNEAIEYDQRDPADIAAQFLKDHAV